MGIGFWINIQVEWVRWRYEMETRGSGVRSGADFWIRWIRMCKSEREDSPDIGSTEGLSDGTFEGKEVRKR